MHDEQVLMVVMLMKHQLYYLLDCLLFEMTNVVINVTIDSISGKYQSSLLLQMAMLISSTQHLFSHHVIDLNVAKR
jgi:hypothetical protein